MSRSSDWVGRDHPSLVVFCSLRRLFIYPATVGSFATPNLFFEESPHNDGFDCSCRYAGDEPGHLALAFGVGRCSYRSSLQHGCGFVSC